MSFLSRIFLLLVGAGCVLTFMGGRDYWLATKAGTEPDVLTAAELIARGAEGNPYVELSGFVPGDNLIYEEKGGKWTTVWIPFGSLEADASVSTVRAVFKSNQIKSESDLVPAFSVAAIRGMVMNKVESLGSKEKKLLSESYPSMNTSEVLIFDMTKNPAEMRKKGMMMGGGGLAALIAGLGLGFVLFVRKK